MNNNRKYNSQMTQPTRETKELVKVYEKATRQSEQLLAAVEETRKRRSEAIQGMYAQGLTLQAIGELLGLSTTRVSSLMHIDRQRGKSA